MTPRLPIHDFGAGYRARPVNALGAGPSVAHLIRVDSIEHTEHYAWPNELVRVTQTETFDRYVMHLPWERNPIPSNGSRGSHHAHAAKVRMVRDTAVYLTRQMDAGLFLNEPPYVLGRCRIRLDWEVTTQTKRDAPNLMLTLKALTDGIRDDAKRGQRGIVRDDTPDLVDALMPQIHYAPRSPQRPRAFMRLHVWPWHV